jgi:DNA-binding response OmpR family regulator
MKVNALVMSRSQASVRLLVAAFAELGVEYRMAMSASEGLDILQTEPHSALIVDFDLPHAVQVAKAARAIAGKRRPVLFGMIGVGTSIADVFQAGANFVLYKPLDLLQVLHSFRAAQGFMHADRRNSSRQKSETLAYLQLPAGTIPALVQDVTEHGISIQAAEPLVPMRGVSLRFLLPRTTQVVHATGDFIWADREGRGGLFFSHMPQACRRDLQSWLRKYGPKKSASDRREQRFAPASVDLRGISAAASNAR